MADDSPDSLPPMALARQFQQASEAFTTQQREWFERLLAAQSPPGDALGDLGTVGDLGALGTRTAMFKTRVQSGGRISIPDAEREALDITAGDLVQAFVVPLERGDSHE